MPHSAPAGLAELQRGFLAFVTDGRAAPAELFHAREQLAVYRDMYALRMAREVAREFPATRALLGPAAFDRITRAYVAAHPSRSFTLEGYGAKLPVLLRRTRARRDAIALAALERALAEVEQGGSAQLLRFGFDVEIGYARFRRGATVRSLHPRVTWLALFRGPAGAARIRVATREVAFLRALLRGGALERAVTAATAAGLRPAAIRRALERWVGRGLLRACYRPGSGAIEAAPWNETSGRA